MPKIETTITKTGAGYTIALQSSKLARGVYISFGDLDVEASDNYFDLLPGRVRHGYSQVRSHSQSAQKCVESHVSHGGVRSQLIAPTLNCGRECNTVPEFQAAMRPPVADFEDIA